MEKVNYMSLLPPLQTGNKLIESLMFMPEYDSSIQRVDLGTRLERLSDLYSIYLPSAMSIEIYNKLYTATRISIQKKEMRCMVEQQNLNYAGMQNGTYRGIIGGIDSFSIIGKSGIGKTSAIDRAIEVITGGKIIEIESPYMKIIPCLSVQCPFDCSCKGMLLEILRVVDECIGTEYYKRAQRAGVTTDIMLGMVAQVSVNHIGLLVIDEIQNVAGHKSGRTLIGMLTQLINSSGVSICMVGTPESEPFFEKAMHMARRAQGMQYSSLEYGEYFKSFCRIVYGYQYVQNQTELSEPILSYLYEHSGGVISIVVSLVHDAQEMAIFNGYERLDIKSLDEAYEKRLALLHSYIEVPVKEIKKKARREKKYDADASIIFDEEYLSLPEIVSKSKSMGYDFIDMLREFVSVEEVAL